MYKNKKYNVRWFKIKYQCLFVNTFIESFDVHYMKHLTNINKMNTDCLHFDTLKCMVR